MPPCASRPRSVASSRNASSEIGTIATASDTPYVGRFAPSPTGPLHFGSLLAAVASFLQARANRGQWLVRVEDIDPPREQPGATDEILRALEHYGFEWHGPVSYQSSSRVHHEEAIRALLDADLAYPCGCSRRDLEDEPHGPLGAIYPGTCRDGTDATETAIRARTTDDFLSYEDGLQGRQAQLLESESGDFIILRRDGLIAYQLAVVVDDHLQGITEVIRGIDLMDSTPRQIWLQRLLGFETPGYAHIPVAVNRDGKKLSKSTGTRGVSFEHVNATLVAALEALGQQPPPDLRTATVATIWDWAISHWTIDAMRGRKEIPEGSNAMVDAENGLS